jgi:hypothetical protein
MEATMSEQLKNKRWLALGAILVGLLLVGTALAAPNAASIDWWVIAGGGGQDGAATSLGGTMGQWVAGSDAQLCAGFWCGVGPGEFKIFLPLVMREA